MMAEQGIREAGGLEVQELRERLKGQGAVVEGVG